MGVGVGVRQSSDTARPLSLLARWWRRAAGSPDGTEGQADWRGRHGASLRRAFLWRAAAAIAIALLVCNVLLLFASVYLPGLQPFGGVKAYSLMALLTVLVAGIAVLVVTAFLNILFVRFILWPLSLLRDAVRRVAESKDYRLRAVRQENNEIGELVDDFNRMLASIERDHLELRGNEQRLRQFSEATAYGVLQFDNVGKLRYCNQQLCSMTGLSREQLLKNGLMPVVHPHDETVLQQLLCRAIDNAGAQQAELRIMAGNGRRLWVSICLSPISDDGGGLTGFMATVADISASKSVHERLEKMAYYDPLTGLANRRMFSVQLGKLLQGGRRRRRKFALILMDIDLFKQVNDALGHDAGDAFLVEIARRIQNCVRGSDTVARIGGDEFALLLENAAAVSQVTRIVRAIAAAMEEPVSVEGHVLHVTASMGVVVAPRDGNTEKELLKHADLALYGSKHAGRNTYRFFAPGMHM